MAGAEKQRLGEEAGDGLMRRGCYQLRPVLKGVFG
eukprot:CAMPEP_0204361226 /NCGR_PEP_ID=MMETSP0469-20131031/38668_1 /ASSEMBLY_ACC=CAM_ASM_000384 /TAXON_ID=2969 /ORGANISM="Oxyrrhis marina" /LENGTH=34 /DNA_ID= /DNA_START= /DNA_END= /DNA_ORIENTATION=